MRSSGRTLIRAYHAEKVGSGSGREDLLFGTRFNNISKNNPNADEQM